MFKNFKLNDFLNELAFGQQSVQQCECNREAYDFQNEGSHTIESFYKNFLLLETQNYFKPPLKTQNKSSQFRLYEDSSLYHLNQAQIIYLKRKPQVVKFIQIGDKFYDHVAIKLQISNRQKQKLKKDLNRQLQIKQQFHSKWQNTSSSVKQQKQFLQILFDYYIEDVTSFCSRISYIYLVFQRWNEGILQKLDKILRKNQHLIKEFHANKEDKNIRMRDGNGDKRENKLTPIKKMQSVYSSLCNEKSKVEYSQNRTPHFQQITSRKITKPIQVNTIRQQIIKQLVKMTKTVISGLQQQLNQNMLRCDLRIINFIYSSDYKLSNSLIPPSVLFTISSLFYNDYITNVTNRGQLKQDFSYQIQLQLLNISYPSPQELSQVITSHREQYSSDNKKQNDLIILSSLLFKLGMNVLELWMRCQWRLARIKENNSHHWVSLRDKIYVLDLSSSLSSLSSTTSFNSNQSPFNKKNSLKIDWLMLANLLKDIQGNLSDNDRVSILFLKVLRSLLNRSAVERRKAQSLLKDEQFENIFKPTSNFYQQLQKNNNIQSHFPITQNRLLIRTQFPNNLFQNVTMSPKKNHLTIPIQRKPSNVVSSTVNLPLLRPQQCINGFYQQIPNSNLYISQNFYKKTSASNFLSASEQYVSNTSIKSYISEENVLNNVSETFKSPNQNNVNLTTMTSFNVSNILLPSSSISFKTSQFKQRKIHSEYQRVNSISQDEVWKQLSSCNKKRKEQPQARNQQGHDSKDKITDPQTEKGNSQQSLSQMPELMEESPIKKKPSSLSNQQQELCELPSHLPQSSKTGSVLNVESLINDNNNNEMALMQTNSKNQDHPNDGRQPDPAIIEVTNLSDNNNLTDQLQRAMKKMQADKARQFQSKQYLDPNFQQPDTQQHDVSQAIYATQNYKGGGSYQGYMKDNKRNGYGKLFYHDGSWYEGEWLDDQMNGYGKLYYSHGMMAYEGDWMKDEFHGLGKVYYDKPVKLDGEFDYMDFNLIGDYWAYYEGGLQHDLRQGYGIIMLQNGEYFEGNFYGDRINGQGKFVNLQGETIHGIWKDNILTQLIEILQM